MLILSSPRPAVLTLRRWSSPEVSTAFPPVSCLRRPPPLVSCLRPPHRTYLRSLLTTSLHLCTAPVAADCAYVSRKGGADEARRAIVGSRARPRFPSSPCGWSDLAPPPNQLSNWNTASALYKETFNVSLGIVERKPLPSPTAHPSDISHSRLTKSLPSPPPPLPAITSPPPA